jgi:hypothetical protein
MCRPSSDEQIRGIDKESRATAQEADEMFITPQSVQAETAYRQERTKREFGRATARRDRREQAVKPEPRHARRSLRPTHAA